MLSLKCSYLANHTGGLVKKSNKTPMQSLKFCCLERKTCGWGQSIIIFVTVNECVKYIKGLTFAVDCRHIHLKIESDNNGGKKERISGLIMFVRQEVYNFSGLQTVSGYMVRRSLVTNEAILKNQKQSLIFSTLMEELFYPNQNRSKSKVFLIFFLY